MDHLTLQFRKGDNKPSTLTCVRPDGSRTWTRLHPGIEIHDFAHYAVESELRFRNAFYGTIAKGFDIGDFEIQREQRPVELLPHNLSLEAHQTEHIVNLLQIHHGNPSKDFDFIDTLKDILEDKEIDFPEALNEERLDKVFNRLTELLRDWENLRPGESLELNFEIPLNS